MAPPSLDTGPSVASVASEFGVAMYRVALAIVRDPALAEDVVQDSLLKVWDGLPGFRGDAPLRSWVLRITHNTAVSMLRRIRDEAWDPSQLPEEARSARIEEVVIARSEIVQLEVALGTLDPLSRSVLALREVEHLPYEDIAAALDITVGQVKVRLFRARRKLRAAVRGDDDDGS